MTLSLFGSIPRKPRYLLSGAITIVLFAASLARAEQEVPLWEGTPPGLHHAKPEASEDRAETGRLDRYLSYVSRPTLTLYPAPGAKASNTTVLVVPGGGFRYVCIDKEGHEAARWLNSIGVNAAVLKYRTTNPDKPRNAETIEPVFVDTGRAVRLLRQHASEWGVDPKRLGIMGFSAGAIMAIRLVSEANEGNPSATDPLDRMSNRPDFVAIVYGGLPPGKAPSPNKNWPPFFIVHAADDPKAPVAVMAKAFESLQQSGASAELHIFRRGDHGFGMSPKAGAVRSWTTLCADWMKDLGFIGQ